MRVLALKTLRIKHAFNAHKNYFLDLFLLAKKAPKIAIAIQAIKNIFIMHTPRVLIDFWTFITN